MKKKENGLFDYGTIELKEDIKTDAAAAGSPELELAKQAYCVTWPIIVSYLIYLTDKIKFPIWRYLAKAGLSLLDGLHEQTCKEEV